MSDSAQPQLLHLVIGGELTDLEHTTFKDPIRWKSSACFPITQPLMQPGKRKRSRLWTTPTCAISWSTSIGCSIQAKKQALP